MAFILYLGQCQCFPSQNLGLFRNVVWCDLPDSVATTFRHSRVLRVQWQRVWLMANRGILYPRVTSENFAILPVHWRIHLVHSYAWTSAWCHHVLLSLRKRTLQLWLQRDSLLPSRCLGSDFNFIVRNNQPHNIMRSFELCNTPAEEQIKVHGCIYFRIRCIKMPTQTIKKSSTYWSELAWTSAWCHHVFLSLRKRALLS